MRWTVEGAPVSLQSAPCVQQVTLEGVYGNTTGCHLARNEPREGGLASGRATRRTLASNNGTPWSGLFHLAPFNSDISVSLIHNIIGFLST